ncbi:hypothetical protein ISS85_04360 [Candidatus Microgenomates bacterium]|nr:hypothetical protein [Candidatus Microgenomates bacterium]
MKIQKILSYLKKRPGLIVLILILIVINLANLKPQFYLVGWDNYSSYFNLKTNLFRTLFSTWREYRGLGVPSDSEVVDIFRQVFFLIFSPFVKETLLEQIYFLFCLDIGALGMYFFAREFFQYVLRKIQEQHLDLIAFVAAFFYLFNLDTLATFYFPMIMYINRYASLPILFSILLKLKRESKVSLKTFILIVFSLLFISGSFLTATVFITFLITLIIYSLFLGDFKRQVFYIKKGENHGLLAVDEPIQINHSPKASVQSETENHGLLPVGIYILFFLSINFFWLLPFANYTLQKSKIIKLAPTFIEANESQLNRPTSFYSLDRLLLLYPNFFDTEFTETDNNISHFLYPKVEFFNQPLGKAILAIFPLSYLLGSIIILIKYRKKELFWIPTIIFFYLILVGKEYTPLGFIFNILNRAIPYFDVLFRFGDTKFNIFISFAGGLAAAIFFLFLLNFFDSRLKKLSKSKIILLVPLLLTIFAFNLYFKEGLFGFFMYNKIPKAYFQIAETINKDKDHFRVLHLPIDKTAYWKSYVWGTLSSSFFHFMLDKPFIDRTFEPASMENAYLHKNISSLFDNTQEIELEKDLDKRSQNLYTLLKKTGVKYIIWDKTIATSVYSRGINYWGEFSQPNSERLLENLKKLDLVQTVDTYEINIHDYLDIYKNSYPLSQETVDYLKKNPSFSIELLQLNEFNPKIYFTAQAEAIDSNLDNLLETDLVFQKENYLQDKKRAPIIFPFKKQEAELAKNNDVISLTFENPFQKSGDYFVEARENNLEKKSHYVEILAKVKEENLIISFYHLLLPTIQDQKTAKKIGETIVPLAKLKPDTLTINNSLKDYLADWHILGEEIIADLRLSINDLILPLPANISALDKYVATVVLSEEDLNIEILEKTKSSPVNFNDFQLTEDPNCFKDQLSDYDFRLEKTDKNLYLFSKNGSTCILKTFDQDLEEEITHLELKIDIQGKSADLDGSYIQKAEKQSKPVLKDYVLSKIKPNSLRVCLKERYIDDCFNKHQILNLKEKQTIVVPTEKSVKKITDFLILLSLKNIVFQEQEINIESIVLDQFKSSHQASLKLVPTTLSAKVFLDKTKDISFKIPKALSFSSYYFNPEKDGLYLSNRSCSEKEDSYRTFRLVNNKLTSYFENCYNLFSVQGSFDSNSFYLWNVDYHLFSGKYPKYILDDGFHHYKDEYLSLNQGYPDISFFKDFQEPEGLLDKLRKDEHQKEIDQAFQKAQFQSAYTYIYSQPELDDKKRKDFTIRQDSENEGVLSLSSLNILELPNAWQDLEIKKADTILSYDLPEKVQYQQILPSLWRVTFENTSEENKPLLLVFNEGYDEQWQLYKNFTDLLLGKKEKTFNHLRLSGFANAWEIEDEELNTKEKSFYIFYTPEKLSFLGWIITLASLIFFAKKFIKKPLKDLN